MCIRDRPACARHLCVSVSPAGSMAQPEEIAGVAFLAGAGARSMTATTVFTQARTMMQSPGL